tara:strand:+ start:20361 stop:22265 length:1905 start_codon:yes stop_codon:yes gene_type:complete
MTYFSKKTYTTSSGQASSKQFDIAFDLEAGSTATSSKPYIATAHIKAKVRGSASTDFTINEGSTPSTLTFGGSTTLTAGDVVEIYRETPRALSGRSVDFTNASLLTEKNLDHSAIHNQFLAQEALDLLLDTLKENASGALDAAERKITNLATPTADSDAVTKDYVDTQAVFQGAASAQAWELTGTGSAFKFQLVSPTPSATVNELFVVEVDGLMQTPSNNAGGAVRDFRVYEDTTDGLYYLEFEADSFPSSGDDKSPPNGAKISVQNMGISKSALTGNVIFESGDAAASIITLKGHSSQSAKPLIVQNSGGGELFSVGSTGAIAAASTASATGLTIDPADDGNKGLIVKQNSASQSANLLELQKTDGSALGTAFSNVGNLTIGTGSADATNRAAIVTASGVGGLKITKGGTSTNDLVSVVADSSEVLAVERDGTPSEQWKLSAGARALMVFRENTTSDSKVICTGNSSQTDEIFTVQEVGGTDLFSVDGTGKSKAVTTGSGNDKAIEVRTSGGASLLEVRANGQLWRRGFRAYNVVQAGGFAVNDSDRTSITHGELIATATYERVSNNETRVVLGSPLPDADYVVRAFEEHGSVHRNTGVAVSSKLAGSFIITHTAQTQVSTHNDCEIKWEVLI